VKWRFKKNIFFSHLIHISILYLFFIVLTNSTQNNEILVLLLFFYDTQTTRNETRHKQVENFHPRTNKSFEK
jgi:hypothetical protein